MRFFAQYRVTLLSTSLVIGLAASAAFGQRANQPATSQSPVERGKYLVTIMDCHGCHTPFKNGQPDMTRMLSGHPQDMKISAGPPTPAGWGMVVAETNTAWSGPWGVSFTTNLTPDKATGIGSWTEDMFVKVIRTGKHLGTGRPLMPPMPWRMMPGCTSESK